MHHFAPYDTALTKDSQVSNTIEDRILQIQKRKTAIVNEAFGGKGDSDSMENLKIMFGTADA